MLLSGAPRLVTDFGVAKAASRRPAATGSPRRIALGTPAYMAPEQATADPTSTTAPTSTRSACSRTRCSPALPPFAGAHAAADARGPRNPGADAGGAAARGPLSALEAAVMRCLAKRPADRFQTADELVTALRRRCPCRAAVQPDADPARGRGRSAGVKQGVQTKRWMYVAGAALLAAVALSVWKPWAGSGARPLDANLVAVLPFRTAGADPSVQYLRQGMVDLMQAKLTGEGGPRAADARSVLAAVRDAGGGDGAGSLQRRRPAGVARKLGAGQVLQGSIVGSAGDRLVINAALVTVPGGKTITQTSVIWPQGQSLRSDRSAHGTDCWPSAPGPARPSSARSRRRTSMRSGLTSMGSPPSAAETSRTPHRSSRVRWSWTRPSPWRCPR